MIGMSEEEIAWAIAQEARADRENAAMTMTDQFIKKKLAAQPNSRTYRMLKVSIDALAVVKKHYGKVCAEYETCSHSGCDSSYSAWAVADQALASLDVIAAEPPK